MINTELSGHPDLKWDEKQDGVLLSTPGMRFSGYDCRVLYLPQGITYDATIDGAKHVSVTLLRGKLQSPSLVLKDADKFERSIAITTLEDSLLFLAFDLGDNGVMQDEITGLQMKWTEPASGCLRPDKQIQVDDYVIYPWYLIPNWNGGIHNHEASTDHNVTGGYMKEVHTQLRGGGWMVQYKSEDEKTKSYEFPMEIGKAHPLFYNVQGDKTVVYPWHAYVTNDKGALFMAFEDMRP